LPIAASRGCIAWQAHKWRSWRNPQRNVLRGCLPIEDNAVSILSETIDQCTAAVSEPADMGPQPQSIVEM
jgi:hypothetical protein